MVSLPRHQTTTFFRPTLITGFVGCFLPLPPKFLLIFQKQLLAIYFFKGNKKAGKNTHTCYFNFLN